MYEKDDSSKSGWKLGDRFLFNLKNKGALDYRRGTAMLYVRSDRPLKPGVEGVQSTPRWPRITANVTPPTPEGIVTMLDAFIGHMPEVIEESGKFSARLKALGGRSLRAARRTYRQVWPEV